MFLSPEQTRDGEKERKKGRESSSTDTHSHGQSTLRPVSLPIPARRATKSRRRTLASCPGPKTKSMLPNGTKLSSTAGGPTNLKKTSALGRKHPEKRKESGRRSSLQRSLDGTRLTITLKITPHFSSLLPLPQQSYARFRLPPWLHNHLP